MRNALTGLLISLGFLVPVLASAHSAPKPPKDTTPPSVTSIHISSSNASSTRAKAGDTVTISFVASEKVTPVVLAQTRSLFVRAANTAGNSWSASYVVDARDATGPVNYLLAMTDTSNNVFICSSARIPLVKYCPTTDGSSVTIYKDTTPPPPPADTQAPVIALHATVYATTTDTSAAVSYTVPTATDNVDASVAVSCTPASGSNFALGTTTITCAAQDAAGNGTTSTFAVVVTQEIPVVSVPSPYTMAGQTDESYLCGVLNKSWRYCDDAGTFSFTDTVGEGVATFDLGPGSSMGTGTLQTVTISKDPSDEYGHTNLFNPWPVTISCFTDAAHTSACGDWATISDTAHNSSDGKHWSADFSSLNRTFNQAEYYVMTLNDTGWETPVYGSQSLQEPYWLMTGLR